MPNLTINVEAPVFCVAGISSSSDVSIGVPTRLEAGVAVEQPTASDLDVVVERPCLLGGVAGTVW